MNQSAATVLGDCIRHLKLSRRNRSLFAVFFYVVPPF